MRPEVAVRRLLASSRGSVCYLPTLLHACDCVKSAFWFFSQRLAIELSRSHAATGLTGMADTSHVTLLEQSIGYSDEGDGATNKLNRDCLRQAVPSQATSKRTRPTLHTAVDVEMASGTVCAGTL